MRYLFECELMFHGKREIRQAKSQKALSNPCGGNHSLLMGGNVLCSSDFYFFFLALCQSCNFRTIKERDEGFAFRPKSCYIAMMCHFLIVSLGAGLKFVTSFLPVHGQVGDPEQWSLVVPSIQAVMGIRAASQTRLVTPCGGFPWWGAGQHYPSWRLLLAGRAYMRLSAAIAPASLMCCWAALCAAVLWSSPLWHLNCD